MTGYEGIAQILLENGAKVDERMNKTGWTPLHITSHTGHDKIVNLLIKNGANVNLLTPEGLTAMDLAKETGTSDM